MKKSILIVLSSLFCFTSYALEHVHENLYVQLYPSSSTIEVQAKIVLETAVSETQFYLNENLKPSLYVNAGRLVKGTKEGIARLWKVSFDKPTTDISLIYTGRLNYPVTDNSTPGLISKQGASLFGSTYWYPYFENALFTFDMKVETPPKWKAVSGGSRVAEFSQGQVELVQWVEANPQDDIFLISAPFYEYTQNEQNGLNGVKT